MAKQIRPASFKRYGPREEAATGEFAPGDFILTHSRGVFGKLIRFGESIRYWGTDRKYTRWNHAALVVGSDGALVEALSGGVTNSNLAKYRDTEYHVVRLNPEDADSRDRAQAVAFAVWAVGDPYGWLTILNIGLALVTGCRFTFGIDGQMICSGLVARSLERTSVIFDGAPSNLSPADLAKQFEVEPPAKGTPIGTAA